MAVHSEAKVVRNTLFITAATVAQKAMSFVYFWILSANLSPGRLGEYTGMLGLASLAAIGTDLGLTPLLTREAARHEEDAGKLLRTAFVLKIPMVTGTIILLWILAPALFKLSSTESALLLGGSLIISFDAFTSGGYAILRARQNVLVESKAILIFQSLVFSSGLLGLFLTGDIVIIMAALVFASFVNMIYTLSSARGILNQSIFPEANRDRLVHLSALLPAFAGAGIFTKVYQQADIVLLRALSGATAVGLYSVPAKITTALQTLVPGAMSAAIYPTMSNFAVTDRVKLAQVWSISYGALFVLSLPIGLGLALLTPTTLQAIWPQYISIEPAMRIMLLAVPVLFLPYASGALLNALGREKRNALNRGAMTAASVVLNLMLIPIYGVLGAAMAFIGANGLLVVLDLVGLRGRVPLWTAALRKLVIGSIISALPASLGGWFLAESFGRSFPPLILLLVSVAMIAVLYLILIVLTGTIRAEDLRALRALVRERQTPTV